MERHFSYVVISFYACPASFLYPSPRFRVLLGLRVELVRDLGERALQRAEADLALQEFLEAFRRLLRIEGERP